MGGNSAFSNSTTHHGLLMKMVVEVNTAHLLNKHIKTSTKI